MAVVREILRALALHRRRGLKEETLRKGDMFIGAWLTAAVFIRFAVNASFAMREIGAGNRDAGLAIAEFNMLHFLLAVFLLAFLYSSLFLGSMSLNRRRLGASPLGFPKLFLAELAGLSVNPLGLVVLPFVAPAVLQILLLPRPATGAAALLSCFLAVCLLAWSLGAALTLNPSIGRATGFLRVAFTAAMLALLLANFDFQWKNGVKLFIFQHPFVLTDAAGGGLLPHLRPWSPSYWIMRAALSPRPAPWLALAAGALIAVLGVSALICRRAYGTAPLRTRGRKAGGRGGLSGRGKLFGVLFFRELRFLLGSTGIRIGFAAAAVFSAFTLASRESAMNAAFLGAFAVIAAGSSYSSNLFGKDGAAVKRYFLACLDWGKLFAAKNLAFLSVTAAPLALLSLAAGIRVSAAGGLSHALTAALILFLCVIWGNLASILVPSAEGGRNGVLANQLFPVAVWSVPFFVNRSLAAFETAPYRFVMLGCILLSCFLYIMMMRRISLSFDSEVEGFLERL